MAAAISAIKNRNILAPNMASLSAAAGGQRISEHIHSEGGYYVTTDIRYRHLAERTNEQRVASVSRNRIADYGTVWKDAYVKGWAEHSRRKTWDRGASKGVRPAICTWLLDDLAHLRGPWSLSLKALASRSSRSAKVTCRVLFCTMLIKWIRKGGGSTARALCLLSNNRLRFGERSM
jgi:hypothetical protein